MLRFWSVCLVVAVFCAGVGCTSETEPASPVDFEPLPAPAGPGSAQPRLQTGPDGAIWLSWVAPMGEDRHALRYATLDDTTWTRPKTVAGGTDWFVNWADLPSVQPLPSGRIAAHYLESNGPSALAYAVRIVQTTGEGRWHAPVTPHADGTPTEHGFASLLPWTKDRLLAVWLDGRSMSGDGHGQGEMTLRSGILDAGGTVEQRALVDARTCECCATSAVRVGDEALVAYRNRTEGEVRDIHLVRFDGEQWSDPRRLHDDGWHIEGCPVNGPALAARGARVGVAWFTAANGVPRVKAAFSEDGGRQFTDPIVVAEGQTRGRVDVVLLDERGAVVSWLSRRDDGGTVRARTVTADRAMSSSATIASLPSAARRVGFPKIARNATHLYAAWVGGGDPTAVHAVRAPLSGMRVGR